MTGSLQPGSRQYTPFHELTAATLAGGGCALGYLYLAYLSNLDARVGVFALLGAHFYIAAVMLAYWYYCAQRGREITYGTVILWAVVFRAIGVYGSPILEDDYFRYLLDGCVFVTSGTPFGISPASMFTENTLPAECQILLSRVNNPHLPTIYAPVLQYVFAALHLVAPVNIKALQLTLSLFDLGLILLLCHYAPARYVLLYAWCPLVVKEISFTAHPDIIGVALLMAAFYLRAQPAIAGRPEPGAITAAAAVVLAAMACAAKVFAVLLLPFLLWRLALRYWLLCAVVVALLYLPFLLQGATDLAVLGIFLQRWQFNAGVFLPVSGYFGDWPARVICFTLFGLWWLFYFVSWARKGSSDTFAGGVRGEWVFGVFLLLSPVLNPWYVIWLLPFAVIRPRVWPWALALVVPLSYVFGLNYLESGLGAYQTPPWAYYGQIVVVAAALAVDWWQAASSSRKREAVS